MNKRILRLAKLIIVHSLIVVFIPLVTGTLFYLGNIAIVNSHDVEDKLSYVYNSTYLECLQRSFIYCTVAYIIYRISVTLISYMRFEISIHKNFKSHLWISLIAYGGFWILLGGIGGGAVNSVYVLKNMIVYIIASFLTPYLTRFLIGWLRIPQ